MKKQQSLLDVNPAVRHDDDFYVTPAWMTRALLTRCPIPENLRGRVVEPCAGDGAIVRELPACCDVLTNDLVPRGDLLPDFLLDARLSATWEAFAHAGEVAIVITNPPFDVAFDIVRPALEVATVGVAMLLRISWLEPTIERGPWLKAHPPTRQIVLPRYSFRRNRKHDNVTSAWVLWAKQPWFCQPGFDFVTRAERDRLIAQGAP